MKLNLDKTYQIGKEIRAANFFLKFYYSGSDGDYYYFNKFNLQGELIRSNISIVQGYNVDGIKFLNDSKKNLRASKATIDTWVIEYDE